MTKCIILSIGILITLYQAYRGFALQWYYGSDKEGPKARRVMLLCLADGFTYFVCAASGFLALIRFCELAHHSLDAVYLVLLIFLFLYGIAGITGKLPEILGKVKLS